jgi:conjugal transfer pilus assembly protein TraD
MSGLLNGIAAVAWLVLGVLLAWRAPLHPGGSRWHGLAALGAILPMRRLGRSLAERSRERFEIVDPPAGGVYLGRGFEWTPGHARRLLDGADAACGRLLHAIGRPDERDLFLPEELLGQHLLLLGTTGVGKTRMLELLVTQAIRRGDATAVIDPKGDRAMLQRVIEEARRAGRPFTLVAPPCPAESATYNPLADFADVREVADRIAALLPSGGDTEPFRNFGWELVGTVAAAMVRFGRPMTLCNLRKYGIEDPWALPRELVPGVKDLEKLAARARGLGSAELDALVALASRPRDHALKMASSLLPVLAKLTAGSHRELLSPALPGFSWRGLDETGGVVYFFLGSLLGADTAGAVAKLALLDVQSHLGARYAYGRASRPLSLFVDELGDVVTPAFAGVLNKARGAGVRIVLAGQTQADLEVALGSPARSRQIVGNVNTVVQFRAQSQEDAELFAGLAGERLLPVRSEGEAYEPALFSSGKEDVDDFRAVFSRQRAWRAEPLVPAWAVMQLPVFHFFVCREGRVAKGVVPLMKESGDETARGLGGGMGARVGLGMVDGLASRGA